MAGKPAEAKAHVAKSKDTLLSLKSIAPEQYGAKERELSLELGTLENELARIYSETLR